MANEQGLRRLVSNTITRPNDTTAYASGDAVTDSSSAATSAALFTVANCALRAGGSGWIVDALLIDSIGATVPGSFEVWLSATAFTTFTNDNSAYAPTDAESLLVSCVLTFTTASKTANNAVYHSDRTMIPFQCAATDKNLYGLLIARSAYAPTGNETFTLVLKVLN